MKRNSGQVFEDILYKDLRGRVYKEERFYNAVAENVEFYEAGADREVDDYCIHHRDGRRRYIVIVKCKLSSCRRYKAVKQLTIAKNHIQKMFPNARIFCIYAYGYKERTGRYYVEWIRWI